MYRNLRTFSSLSRSLFRRRSTLPQYETPITVRRVRIMRPFFTARRLQTGLLWATTTSGFFYLLGSLDDGSDEVEVAKSVKQVTAVATKKETLGGSEVEEQPSDEAQGSVVEEEGNEAELPEEPPEDSWFIPLGWARQRPQTFYKGHDPEWQSFVEFSQNGERSISIRNELAGFVGQYLASIKNFQQLLGQPITTGKYWLDIDFPDGPPPDYERVGLEITDDYVALVVRTVHPINVSRLQATLWPTATVSSFLASQNALWQSQIAKVKNFLNIKSSPEPEKPRFPPGYINLGRLSQGKDMTNTGSNTLKKEPSAEAETPEVSTTASSSLPTNSDRAKIFRPLPGLPTPSTEMATASTAFKNTLLKTWKHASAPAPRGTCMVSGFVEVSGPKGMCVMDVRAAYHPAESKWVTVTMGVRRLQQRSQAPKGGP